MFTPWFPGFLLVLLNLSARPGWKPAMKTDRGGPGPWEEDSQISHPTRWKWDDDPQWLILVYYTWKGAWSNQPVIHYESFFHHFQYRKYSKVNFSTFLNSPNSELILLKVEPLHHGIRLPKAWRKAQRWQPLANISLGFSRKPWCYT